MFKKISISTKITALVVAIVLVAVIAISFVSYRLNKEDLQDRYTSTLQVIGEAKSGRIEQYFDQVIANIKLLQKEVTLTEGTFAEGNDSGSSGGGFDMFSMDIGGDTSDPFASDVSDDPFAQPSDEGFGLDDTVEPAGPTYDVPAFLNDVKQTYGYREVIITEGNGKVLFSTNAQQSAGSNFDDPDGSTVLKSSTGVHFSNVKESEDGYYMYAGAPITNSNGQISLIFLQLAMDEVYNIVNDTTGLGETGEIILARKDSSRIVYINKPRNKSTGAFEILTVGDPQSQAVQNAVLGEEGVGANRDYRGEENLAYFNNIPNVNWGLVAKIDTDEIYDDTASMFFSFLVVGLIMLFFAAAISLIFSKYIVNPLLSLKKTLELVGGGTLPENIERKTVDEIGDMTDSVNNLVDTLKNTARFAQQIGEGNFTANYELVNDDDVLGTALVNMRDNLVEAEKRDKERNWIVTGVAEIGEILRAHDTLEPLGDAVIKYIIGKIGAVQGAFYVVNDEDVNSDSYLKMLASYAYNRKKHLQVDFKFAEGLVGQSAAEQDTVLRTEIPHDYVSITSGILGDKRPTCILIVPLITEEKVYGAVEFAGFEKFDSSKVKFVEELSLILARTVFNIKVNERTRRLLQESQQMSSELQEKQEILRQNAEEMQATQEELQKSNSKLEEQIEEVNRTQNRMQLLLENASEVITIYEEDQSIRYISPSVEPILGYSQKEMIGSTDLDKVKGEYKESFQKMFTDLLAKPDDQVTIQYEYRSKDGHYIWIESTGTNFMSNPAIHGIIVNSTDITERRLAEQEQRMRSKMQALSENSLDLITRLENDEISYINPVIEEYTGKNPQTFLNKKIEEADLNHDILDRWLEIVEEVNNTNDKVASEMDFPSEKGDRVMQVNAIPEFDDNEKLESVLVVSHDITERKLIELEIQNKNKKIADSINYAKRIQNAILPNNNVITRVLPDSFILYKPKDVVSGDFPWYVKMGDDIYMAAVDCTGHGVPGALLSLIGYFLLNDIVRSRKISDPGIILDQLDEGVTTTLRQDQDDSKTKDGMDIALCKINKEKRTVEYAGAHRPLYVVKDGEMVEIKGNKFAIGGGIYKNQTNFTNHKVELSAGDSFYFCSDGFPDQFGGPDNRKFGPKRTREYIMDVHDKSMREAYQVFDDAWEGWKGDEKQTDDVLLIGIKL